MVEVTEPIITPRFRQNMRYRKRYMLILHITLISLVIMLALSATLFYRVAYPPKQQFFWTSVNNRVGRMIGLDMPNQSDSAVLQWANQAAIIAYTMNFVNYADAQTQARPFFTTAGWNRFQQALASINFFAKLRSNRLSISAVATRPPIVLEKGIVNGRYSWRIQMPLLVTSQSQGSFSQASYLVTMLIQRIRTTDNPRGIGIAQIFVERAGGGPV